MSDTIQRMQELAIEAARSLAQEYVDAAGDAERTAEVDERLRAILRPAFDAVWTTGGEPELGRF